MADICRHLDGLPLAVELAAARVRLLSPTDLLARLGERFRLLAAPGRFADPTARQATLRATVDWSYDLLAADEQRLFDALSVFAGGFDLSAATEIAAGPGADELNVLELLGGLVDKSMVEMTQSTGVTRYRLLETMRQYGADHLVHPESEDRLRDRHAAFYADFVERASAGLRGADELLWSRAIATEFDNLRAAVRWALDRGEKDLALRIITSLWTYPLDRVIPEPAEWAERAVGSLDLDDHTSPR